MKCKHCNAANPTKAGDHQRYKCRICTRHFTDTKPHGKSAAGKAFAVHMNTVCNAIFDIDW